jgi:Putative peptidoglycan binding domain/Peptidase_C39 like family
MAPSEKTLQHETNRQDNGYYCGPASTRVALTTRGIYVEEYVLAGKLGTTTAGTNSSADVVRVLNQYVGAIYDDSYLPGETATPAEIDTMRSRIVSSVMGGFGLVVNVVGTGRDVDGHAYTYSGGHYVAACGYRYSGDQVLVTDVAIGRDYWMTASALAIWCARRGYSFAANVPVEATELSALTPIPAGAGYPLQGGHYYGDIKGPSESHGGYYLGERPVVRAIQQRLIVLGFVAGITDPNSPWADGLFEQPTVEAVQRFQAANGLVVDGKVGPVTWSALFPRTPAAPVSPPAVPTPAAPADPALDVAAVTP